MEDKNKNNEIKPDGGLYKNVKITKKGLDIFLIVGAIIVIVLLILLVVL